MLNDLIWLGSGFIAGWVVGYLVLRNNPKVKAALDKKVDAVSKS